MDTICTEVRFISLRGKDGVGNWKRWKMLVQCAALRVRLRSLWFLNDVTARSLLGCTTISVKATPILPEIFNNFSTIFFLSFVTLSYFEMLCKVNLGALGNEI